MLPLPSVIPFPQIEREQSEAGGGGVQELSFSSWNEEEVARCCSTGSSDFLKRDAFEQHDILVVLRHLERITTCNEKLRPFFAALHTHWRLFSDVAITTGCVTVIVAS